MDAIEHSTDEIEKKADEEIISFGKIESGNENQNSPGKRKKMWRMGISKSLARYISFILNQGLATLAFFGVGVNLVLFLTRVLDQDSAVAANNVSKWTGTVYLCSLIGAFLSDSYWGRYLTCAIFQLILVLGLGLLSFASWFFLISPTGCGDGIKLCNTPSSVGVVMFYLSIYLIALGYGGHQPTVATLGADQFDDSNPNAVISKAAFFSSFYFALNVGSLFSNTILVYYEDSGKWTLGFLVSFGAAIIALLLYLSGTSRYRYVKASGNPLPRVAQVFVAAYRKWGVTPATVDALYEVEGTESAIKGSRKYSIATILSKFLDKAATITSLDLRGPNNPWKLCTVTQVEEAKCVLKMLPIWLCTIMYSVIFTQMASLFVEQGDVMASKLKNFRIPAASMSAFDICSVLIWTGVYRHVVVPVSRSLTGNPKGLTELQRMGTGLIIGMIAMVAAGVTEIERLKSVSPEFFNGQAPDGIKSFGSSLCMASMSLGNYVSSLLINIVMEVTTRDGGPGWIPDDLNDGHMDRFYFLIAGLTAVDFIIYVYCAKCYYGNYKNS
ncbi:hypothetical protein CXB51_036210 [Gossypium anomalum]|uniref:Uncharacterized protein n=1 Tax=Gossypium anomalum TaxID=47600 RepID=A0A8J5Y714_9ROSI|nr:hypothetical protein CXB51_036210 [Gossypium anomalum]